MSGVGHLYARVLCALGVPALAVAVAVTCAPAAAAAHRRSHRRGSHVRAACALAKSHHHRSCPSGTKLARTLARGMIRGSLRSRERAMISAMRDLHIGVMSRTGKALVVAPEIGGAQYFQLYDFELRAFAEQLRAGATTPLSTLAARLAALAGGSLKVGGKPVSAAAVRTLLLNTTRYALRHPRSPRSRLPLLVRELGRRHKGPRYDLAKKPAASKIALDPLQEALVEMDLVLPILREIHAPAPAPGHAHRSVAAADAASRCKRLLDIEAAAKAKLVKALGRTRAGRWISSGAPGEVSRDALKGGWVGAKLAIKKGLLTVAKGLLTSKSVWGKAFGVVTKRAVQALGIANALHDVMLSALITVDTSHGTQQTHWNHGDGRTGQPMTFAVAVRMGVDLGKTLVNCGTLAGFKFPPKGPLAGVPVSWHDKPNSLMTSLVTLDAGLNDDTLTPDMGTTNCGTLPCTTSTGANGIAQLVFTPKSEPIPGVGPVHQRQGHIFPTVLYQSAEGGGLFIGQIAQYLFPKGVAKLGWTPPGWQVSWHDVPNLALDFKATVTPQYRNPPVDSSGPIVCGQAITGITDTGALTVEGTAVLTPTSPAGSNPVHLSWQPVGPLPLQYTDASLEEDTDISPPVGDCPYPLPTHSKEYIQQTQDGTMSIDGLAWDKANAVAGTPGISAVLELANAPTETYYDTLSPPDEQNGPQAGWADAVNQVLGVGTNWDYDEYDVTGNRYTITGWQRSTEPGVYATRDINEDAVIDNQIPPVNVNVTIHMELRPLPPG